LGLLGKRGRPDTIIYSSIPEGGASRPFLVGSSRSRRMFATRFLVPAAALAAFVLGSPRVMASEEMTERARKFVKEYERKISPLEKAGAQAWWDANISGNEEDFKKKEKAQNQIDEALADPKAFAELKAIHDAAKQIDDPVLARAIDILYRTYLEKQVDPDLLKQIVARANAVEKAFNKFRAKVEDKELEDSKVRDVLKNSTSSERRKAVWEASKKVGAVVEADLKELVKLRNEAAKKLGFKNYHALQLFLNEQDGDEIIKLFDELDRLTKEPCAAAKAEMDEQLAKRCKIKVEELRPWHYHDPFFQETPAVFSADIDEPFKSADLEKLTTEFYRGIGLPVDDVLRR